MAAAVAISSTVKYGIIGVGMMGREHLINLHHLRTEGVAVVAIADPHVSSQDFALQLAQSFNWPLKVFSGHRELLDSGLCDVLVVSAPNMTHYEILMDIINHPKPHNVLVEKPLCTTVAHCKEVVVVNDKEEETVEASNMVEPVDPNAVEITDNIVFQKLLRGPRYFDPPDSGWGACFNCGEEGYTVANCIAAKRKKPCFVCGSLEHNAKQCSKGQDCFICKKSGHRAKDCPEKYKGGSLSLKICLKCGDSGHDMFSCWNDYSPDDLKFFSPSLLSYPKKQNQSFCHFFLPFGEE